MIMSDDDDDDYSHSVLTWGGGRSLSCCGRSVKALGCALGSSSHSLLVWREKDLEALSGSLSCQDDIIRTVIVAVPLHKIINELGRIKWIDFSVQKFNLRLLSNHKSVSLSAFFGISIYKIETWAGKSYSVLAFLGSLVLDRTLGFWKVFGFIVIIGIEGIGISGRKHNLFRLALSLGTRVVWNINCQ